MSVFHCEATNREIPSTHEVYVVTYGEDPRVSTVGQEAVMAYVPESHRRYGKKCEPNEHGLDFYTLRVAGYNKFKRGTFLFSIGFDHILDLPAMAGKYYAGPL